MSEWKNKPDKIEEYEGFVYLITNLRNKRFYIGQKRFWTTRRLPALKGRTKKEQEKRAKLKGNKRHIKKESNWKDYWGSSRELKQEIKIQGKDSFERKILKLCKNKLEMNYFEFKEQITNDILFNRKSYNNMINVRFNGNNLKKLIDKEEHDTNYKN